MRTAALNPPPPRQRHERGNAHEACRGTKRAETRTKPHGGCTKPHLLERRGVLEDLGARAREAAQREVLLTELLLRPVDVLLRESADATARSAPARARALPVPAGACGATPRAMREDAGSEKGVGASTCMYCIRISGFSS